MNNLFADRMHNTPKSFIREILKVTENPEIISFAGGLPNPRLFPSKEIADAASKVLEKDGSKALQYSTTEGYYPLREFISRRYMLKKNLKVDPDQILITNGSQQGIDLMGKVFINRQDHIIIESPGYLGAIQALTVYEPVFHPVKLNDDGIDTEQLEETLNSNQIKLFYSVPNFQNPSGVSYSMKNRQESASILKKFDTILIEDDPYCELRFLGEDLPYIGQSFTENSVLLGSFSKMVAPALRMGWICTSEAIMEKTVVAKQASDLHSNYLSQRIIYQYLCDNDIEDHLTKVKAAYKLQRDAMVNSINMYFPEEVSCTKPEGGMFIWVTLPENISSLDLFDLSIRENVAFVPGSAFHVEGKGINTFRLNYSNSDEDMIEEGIKRLANSIKKLMC